MINPFKSIWINPKKTIETFFQDREGNGIYGVPFVIYGISLGLYLGTGFTDIFDTNPTFYDQLMAYLFSIPLGIGLTYLFLGFIQPWFIKVVGQLWKGQASRSQLANVNALATIPYILVLLNQLILLIIGKEPFINEGIEYLIWILSFRILIIGVSVVQKFSYGLALLNIALSILPIVILRFLLNGS